MDTCSVATILDDWLPVVTLAIGAVLTYVFGLSRDQYQRREDRKDNRKKLQRDELNELQLAADELFQNLYRALLVNNDPIRAELWGLKPGEGEKWQERFETSDRKFRVLASHVADRELQTRIDTLFMATTLKLGQNLKVCCVA